MNWLIRHGGLGLLLFFCLLPAAHGQSSQDRVFDIVITNVGPEAASPELVRANIHVKKGDVYTPKIIADDIRSLYDTRLFDNIQIVDRRTPDGVVLTYILRGKYRLTGIRFDGNTSYSNSKLLKKVSSKVGKPLDEMQLLDDEREIEKLYESKGHVHTTVRYELVNINQAEGQAAVLFHVTETPKIQILDVQFAGANAFTQKKLRSVLKTRRHWMFSWITQSGVFKADDFEEDQDTLADFYRKAGYIDFEIKATNITYPSPREMNIQFVLEEGRQYRVGSITFKGATLLPTNAISPAFKPGPEPKASAPAERSEWQAERLLNRQFVMKSGSIYTPAGFAQDRVAIEDYYGSKGYIDVGDRERRNLQVVQVPNTETGTMDMEFDIDEGLKSRIEKIEIQGNVKTRDTVIRRELAVSPGDTFDMVRVKLSQQRLEGLGYFTPGSVQAKSEADPSLPSDAKNLIITVEETNTGAVTFGAGYNTVESISGFVSVEERNFDLFKPPYFIGSGGGQKIKLYIQVGTQVQNYQLTFQEPWFLGRHLILDTSLYHTVADYQSIGNLYDVGRTGMSAGLTRALGSEFLIGNVNYSLEQVNIFNVNTNAPDEIVHDAGHTLLNRFGAGITVDSRNNVQLPNKGTRTGLTAQLTLGERSYLKTELSTAWYFRGIGSGDVIEVVGRGGVAQKLGSEDVPFFDRYYLGGLRDLRGYEYTGVGPRAVTQDGATYEPIGGDTYWMGSVEYSIPLVSPHVRFAMFYDIGNVSAKPFSNEGFDVIGKSNNGLIGSVNQSFTQFVAGNTGTYSDNVGIGLHLDIPHLGPLRLDYGIPLHHDVFNSNSGKFQFGVGFTRPL